MRQLLSAASPGGGPNADICVQGLDDAAADARLVFSRIDNPANAQQQFRDVRQFDIANVGGAPLTISDISIGGTDPGAFQVTSGPANGTVLAAGGSATVVMEFVGSDPDNDNAAVSYDAVLSITSDDPVNAITTVALSGLAQIQSEGGEEPAVAQIVQAFGYGTDVAQGQLANGGLVETIGDEVLMPYLQRLDSLQPVEMIQIAAYLRQGDVARLEFHGLNGVPVTELFAQDEQEGQTLLPNQLVAGAGAGTTARGEINFDTPFGLHVSVDNRPTFASWSDPEANERDPDIGSLVDDGDGHLIRFFQAKDAGGNVIAGTFIGIQDYPGGGNFDYNDHMIVIKNVQPYALTAAEDGNGNGINDALETDSDGDSLVDFFDRTVTPPSPQTPFPGPGPAVFDGSVLTLDASNYDEGGQGVAYNDAPGLTGGTDSGRIGSDVEQTAVGDIGWVADGEWLEYTIEVPTTGLFDIDLLMSTTGSGRSVTADFFRAGETASYATSGAIANPSTGSWTDFQSRKADAIALEAGEQVLRVTFHGGAQDLRSLTLAPNNAGGPFTFTIQGEQLTIDDTTGTTAQDGLTVVNDLSNPETVSPERPNGLWPGYSGTGYLNLGGDVGDAAFFTVNVPAAGGYELSVRYANGSNLDRSMSVLVNGVEQTTLAFASTTAWDNWTETAPVTLTLAAGANTIRLENTIANGPNIDRFTVSRAAGSVASEPGPRPTIAINFQDGTTPVVPGMLVDSFQGFGDRANGFSYGWVTEATATDADGTNATPIDAAAYPAIAINERTGPPFDGYDPRLTGYAHFDLASYPERTAWEIALAAGSYEITVSVGDTGGPNDSNNQLLAEGNLVTGWQPTDTYKSQLLTAIATVTDGFLTLAAPGGTVTEIQYLEIRELPDLTPADGNPASNDYAQLANPVALGAAGTTPQPVAIGTGLRPDNVDPTRSFAFDVGVVDGRGGVLETSLTTDTIQLYETLAGAPAAFSVNTTGGFDAVVINPTGDLKENTSYTIVVDGLLDRGSNTDPNALPREFEKYTATFVTGTAPVVADRPVAFVDEVLATEGGFSSVAMSPDGQKLYVSTLGGRIIRWNLDPTTGAIIDASRQELADPLLDGSVIIGLVFDPTDANRLWVTSNEGGLDSATDFTGRVVTVDIATDDTSFTATTQPYIVGLPRSVRDHLTNSLAFRENPNAGQAGEPSHLLYLMQGSNSAMGAPDSAWGYRAERALSAAVIEIDPTLDVSGGPLDVQTETPWTSTAATALDPLNDPNNPNSYNADGSVTGFYNPFASNAPVRVFAGGQRNAYDLVWHSNGFLYVPTNGSAGGANSPDDPSTPQNEGLTGIPTRNDYLFAVEEGGFYGHPNPIRGDFILNGGNPTAGNDPAEVGDYPVGTLPDPNYRGFAFDFGRNVSPNGAAEFTSNVFGSNLRGAIIVAQFSGPDNLIALTPGPDGNIVDSQILRRADGSEISYGDPLDLSINPATGDIYLVTFNRGNGSSQLVLLTPDPGDVIGPPPVGLTFQAEDSQFAAIFTGSESTSTNFIQILSNNPGFNGTGFVDYGNGIAGDETLQFDLPGLAGGEYDLVIRYALNGADRPLDLTVNGTSQELVSFPDTDGAGSAGFLTWGTVTERTTLNPGTNVIALTSTTNAGPNIDEITLVPITARAAGVTFNGDGNANRSGIGTMTLDFSTATTVATAASLNLFNHTTGQSIDLSAATLANNGTTSITWDLSAVNLPNGRYTAELPAYATTPRLTQSHTIEFFKLAGDLDGDGFVNFNDFFAADQDFNASGSPYRPGDADGDGMVNFNDFFAVDANFNVSLAALSPDFGDAPDSATFPTTLANDGARHVMTGNDLFLGAGRDSEPDGQSSLDATGDDIGGGDDEDGIVIVGNDLVVGTSVGVTVTANVPATAVLNGWVDFNQDGDWDDPGEQVFVDIAIADGTNNLSIAVPSGAALGMVFARFRITETVGYSYFGLAPDGEVEDDQLTVTSPPAPAPQSSPNEQAPPAAPLPSSPLPGPASVSPASVSTTSVSTTPVSATPTRILPDNVQRRLSLFTVTVAKFQFPTVRAFDRPAMTVTGPPTSVTGLTPADGRRATVRGCVSCGQDIIPLTRSSALTEDTAGE